MVISKYQKNKQQSQLCVVLTLDKPLNIRQVIDFYKIYKACGIRI